MPSEKTQFKSGNPGKPKGAVSKVTADVRAVIKDTLEGITSADLGRRMKSLEDKDFIDAYVKLSEFVVPKLQRTTLSTDEAGDAGTIRISLNLNGPKGE